MLRLLSILFCCLIYSQASAQDLFEHLSHKDGTGGVVSYLATDEGIFYHDNSLSTKIKFISYDNEIDVLWGNTKYTSQWSEFKKLDGEDWILLVANFIDYDVFIPELWIFKYTNGSLSKQVVNFDGNFSDMLYVNENSILLTGYDFLMEINDTGEVINLNEQGQGSRTRLNQNQFGENYLANKTGKIYSIGEDLELLLKNDTGQEIIHFSSIGDNKSFIGTEQNIYIYNSDCTDLISSFDTPSGGTFVNFESLLDYNSYALEKLNDEFFVWHLSPDGDFIQLHHEACNALNYRKIALHKNHIFEQGYSDIGNGSGLTHFKSISIDPNFDDQTPRPEITINDFQVFLKKEYTVYDTFQTFIHERIFRDYYFEFRWNNSGPVDINCYDVFVSFIESEIMPTLGAKVTIEDEVITTGEFVTLEGWISVDTEFTNWFNPNYEPNELFFPGANNLPICVENYVKDEMILNNGPDPSAFESSFNIFPNPSHSMLEVNNLRPGALVYILNSQGVKIWSGKSNENQRTIDISTFQSGLYYITDGVSNKPFIKH